MPNWEYAVLTRLSAGLDTKWYVNRVFQHAETEMPEEVTESRYRAYNDQFDALHASKVFPVLPSVLNILGADGWELIDDMDTGVAGGEGLVLKRPYTGRAAKRPVRAAPKGAAKRAAKKTGRARR
jgi:hypothetical protein